MIVDANVAAEVLIDGVPSGSMTPTLGLRVQAGSHQLQLRSGDGAPGARVPIVVKKGETLRLTMAAPPGAPPPSVPAVP